MIRRLAPGRRPAAWATARDDTRRYCCLSGKVLVAGGRTVVVYLSSAELYDPANGNLERRPAALSPHVTLTRRGCCPMARCWWRGERMAVNPLSSAELYDPAIGTWTATGSLVTARSFHTATLLPTGKVLVAGGSIVDLT